MTSPRPSVEPSVRLTVGGQALVEGVMMRSPHALSVVLRRRDGSLLVRTRSLPPPLRGWRSLPLARGLFGLLGALRLGNAALRFSLETYAQDREGADAGAEAGTAPPVALGVLPRLGSLTWLLLSLEPEPGVAGTAPEQEGRVGLAPLLLGLLLLLLLPHAVALGLAAPLGLEPTSLAFQGVTTLAQLGLVLGYLLALRRVPEIHRLFQYHGAEHQAVHTYEAAERLTVAGAREKSRLHPRCGTSFVVMVSLVGLPWLVALAALTPTDASALTQHLTLLALKLLSFPLLVGLTFELQRQLARWSGHRAGALLSTPGFLAQRVTTIAATDEQREIALAALGSALLHERQGEPGGPPPDQAYPGFEALTLPG